MIQVMNHCKCSPRKHSQCIAKCSQMIFPLLCISQVWLLKCTSIAGGFSSALLAITTILHYFFILDKCHANAYRSSVLMDVAVCLIHILIAISFMILYKCVKQECQQPKKSAGRCTENQSKDSHHFQCFAIGITLTATILSLATTSLSVVRDHKYLKSDESCKEQEIGWEIVTYSIHALLKLVTSLCLTLTSFYAMGIFYVSGEEWNTDTISSQLDKSVDNRFFTLYRDYIRRGQRIEKGCNLTLQQWFALMCLIYFLFILSSLIQAIKTINENNLEQDYLDIAHSFTVMAFCFCVFIGPYTSATHLNYRHHRYYLAMLEKYQEHQVIVELDDPDKTERQKTLTYLCKSGDRPKCITEVKTPRSTPEKTVEQIPSAELTSNEQQSTETSQLLTHAQPAVKTPSQVKRTDIQDLAIKYQDRANEMYKEYYLKTMEKKMDKIDEFDFVPTIMFTTLPLDNQGYIFAILLTTVSIAFGTI